MHIRMQFGLSELSLSYNKWDYAFIGHSVDERGKKAVQFSTLNSISQISISYDPVTFTIKKNGTEFNVDTLEDNLTDIVGHSVLIDSTTLNFPELLLILQTIKNLNIEKVDILYLEPGTYRRKKHTQIIDNRDFELSEAIIGYTAIPGHALSISSGEKQSLVFICGYESERVDRALEESQFSPANCSCIFGVPAFNTGWEMDSFVNNITVIKERRISGDINYCAADNPLSVYSKLEDIYQSLEEDAQLFIAPLSTKPMSIGACLFSILKPKNKVAILYDHPNETTGRSQNSYKWHIYNVEKLA